MITIKLVLCKRCGVQYYAGEQDIKILAGNERNPPTEIYFTTLKVSKCPSCLLGEARTASEANKRFQ